MSEISIVIPAFNEEVNIGITVTKIASFLNEYENDYEIIIVNDGSCDSTQKIVEEIQKDNEKIHLINNPHKGKGFAVRTGVLRAKGKLVLLFDADSAVPIDELKRFRVWVTDNGFDIVIGSREGVGAVRKNEPYVRHLMGRIFNLLVRILVLSGIDDTQCGFKLFKGPVAKEIFSKALLYGDLTKEVVIPKVTAYDVEILFIAKKMGFKIKEMPVVWEYGTDSKVRTFSDTVVNFLDVVKVKLNSIKGLY